MTELVAMSLRMMIRSLGFIVLPIAILAWFIGWIKEKYF